MSDNIKTWQDRMRDYQRDERHQTKAETMYWMNQYKILAQNLIDTLAATAPTVAIFEKAAQACDQQADGADGSYRFACLQCADAVRELRDAAISEKTVSVDEISAFEEAVCDIVPRPLFLRSSTGEYKEIMVQGFWYLWQARAKPSAGVAIPEGWALVPLEPTIDMKDAPCVKVGGCYSCTPEQVGYSDCAEIYRAMVASAPSPDQQGQSNDL